MQKSILIVDDDARLLELLTEAFVDAGFSVIEATTGLDALKKARSHLPDLIVLDLVLPETDGFTVCEALRRNRATAGIPIIMLTGLTGELSRFAGLGCGANDYMTKPVSPGSLIARVAMHLRNSSPPLLQVAQQGRVPARFHSGTRNLARPPARAVAEAL